MTKENLLKEFINLLDKNINNLEKDILICCNITIKQCRILLEIGSNSISLNDLAKQLDVDKSTMSRNIDQLVKLNLIKRNINNDNRRYIDIMLTKDGQELYKQINIIFDNYYKSVIFLIPEEKRNQVEECLQYLIKALNENLCCLERI